MQDHPDSKLFNFKFYEILSIKANLIKESHQIWNSDSEEETSVGSGHIMIVLVQSLILGSVTFASNYITFFIYHNILYLFNWSQRYQCPFLLLLYWFMLIFHMWVPISYLITHLWFCFCVRFEFDIFD